MTWSFILRLVVAALLGALIGLDREYRAKEAGLRTHFLVAVGSALMMIVSQYGFFAVLGHEGVALDPSRVAAQVVSGIGFIGAGTIIIQKQFVRGLSTAAGLWATAGIGMAVGCGMYVLGICAMVLTLVGLELSTFFLKNVGLHSSMIVFSTSDGENLKKVTELIHKNNYRLVTYEADKEKFDNVEVFHVTMVVKMKNYTEESKFFQFLQSLPNLTIDRIE